MSVKDKPKIQIDFSKIKLDECEEILSADDLPF